MTSKFFTLLAGTTLLVQASSLATSSDAIQNPTQNSTPVKTSRIYTTTSMEGSILSTSTLEKFGTNEGITTPRFTNFFHTGINLHLDANKNFGVITGLGLRNIGFIEKVESTDSTIKRRIYGLTLPLILKFGNMPQRHYFFAGAEATLAVNYKEKGYVKRSDKDKFNEWFSDRTPLIHTSITAGYQHKYGYLKFNYYLNNFLNPDYVDNNNVRPYEGYNVNLMSLAFGWNLPHKSKFYNVPYVNGLR